MEVRLYVADTILFIVTILSNEKLEELYNFFNNFVMEFLVEALMKSKSKRSFVKRILELKEKNAIVAIEAADAVADIIGLIFAKSRRQVPLDLALEIFNVIREMQSEKTIEITDDKDELTPYEILINKTT
ncbi:2759_t:CDS:2 [Funneliformis mosseae]|uniref:2759_t:CDS:1 n=1 Tax=Funneliformis mosseae TaxID=27381 RepID=A0A9N9G1Z5_FUNMO|nr:2759_t:CDS:2 [Funneliformis mosseae]